MLTMLATLLGGIGLFILGMTLLTDGLKAIAGEALQRLLARFTGGPIRGLVSGTLITALLQSSSATTLTTIGFVSAGLLTFTQATGLIFGANLGTTSTGWLVSLLGLKFSVGMLAMPFVGVGALLKLTAKGRAASCGLALAGFGLLFIGIDTLQLSMQGLSAHLNPGDLPGETFFGRILLIGLGVVMSVVMQSSSAAVATTLAALHSGTIGLDEAAALVIGQNIGTTVTAGIAAIGASVAAKRTALAHTLFNAVAGLFAFLLLPLLNQEWNEANPHIDGAIALAAFHTAFNALGVIAIMPFVGKFSRFVEKMIPEKDTDKPRFLDNTVAEVPAIAIDAVRRTLEESLGQAVGVLSASLSSGRINPEDEQRVEKISKTLIATSEFLGKVSSQPEMGAEVEKHVAVLRALDNITSFVHQLGRKEMLLALAHRDDPHHMRAKVEEFCELFKDTQNLYCQEAFAHKIHVLVKELKASRERSRETLIQSTARGETKPNQALIKLEAWRWGENIAEIAEKATLHLRTASSSQK